jgi:putative membrane protein insertion efficiency factor
MNNIQLYYNRTVRFLRKFYILPIRFYQRFLSPRLTQCRYTPTCSHYAIDAINEYGIVGGTLLGAYRILRCNPFSKGGVDKVKLNKRGDAKWTF